MDLDQADGWFRSGNRQIVKSTVIADWQQKAGSWSAQRGGVVRGFGCKESGSKRSETVGRACCQPDFQSQAQAQLDSRVYIIGCASSIRLAPNLVSLLRPCDIARALYTLCLPLFLFVHIFVFQ